MSNTLNRPMFKRGPDGQMRQAKWIGGIMRALPYAYRGAKYLAPKFTNIPHNVKRMMGRGYDVQPPWVGPKGPMDFVPFVKGKPPSSTFDWRAKSWTNKFDALKNKHGLSTAEAFGYKGVKNVPQEVLDHVKIMPKMPWKRSLTEQGMYGLSAATLDNWANYPDDPQANVKIEEGGTSEDKPPTGQTIGAAGGPIPEGPKVPGTDLPDESVEGGQGDEYDGPTTGTTIGAAGGPIPDLISEATAVDDTISPKSIEDYKKELRGVIGKEDSNMGSLLLMQLGLGMMAGKSYQPGFAGFTEILGKTGQEVLPMWMEHMQNKRKEDKEIALAAYDMLREDRAAKREREQDLADWVWKEEYKMDDWVRKEQYKQHYAGDESMIQVNNPMYTPNGERIDNWTNLKQVFSKSPEAMYIMQNSDPNQLRVVNLSMTDAGAKAAGFGDLNLTKSSPSSFPPKALNISPQPVLMAFKFPKIFSMASSVAPLSFNLLTTLPHWSGLISSKETLTPPLAKSVILGLPDIKASFNSLRVLVLACLFKGSKKGLVNPNTASIFLSSSRDTFCAILMSASLKPRCTISALKNSSGLFPLALNLEANASINRSSFR